MTFGLRPSVEAIDRLGIPAIVSYPSCRLVSRGVRIGLAPEGSKASGANPRGSLSIPQPTDPIRRERHEKRKEDVDFCLVGTGIVRCGHSTMRDDEAARREGRASCVGTDSSEWNRARRRAVPPLRPPRSVATQRWFPLRPRLPNVVRYVLPANPLPCLLEAISAGHTSADRSLFNACSTRVFIHEKTTFPVGGFRRGPPPMRERQWSLVYHLCDRLSRQNCRKLRQRLRGARSFGFFASTGARFRRILLGISRI